MSSLRLITAILLAKLVSLVTRAFGGGGGTAAPGLVALKIYPHLLNHFARQFKKGTILITGTNGKTTTARLISSVLQSQKFSLIHNRTGSNLSRGLASVCLESSSLTGKINQDFGIFEIDEAAFSQVAPELNPKLVIILNLFRDQLDRYGEIDKILNNWHQALKEVPQKTTIILNSDDPSVASLGKKINQKTIYFGLRDKNISQASLSHASDATSCPHCLTNLIYQHCYISHLGVYKCPICGNIQPKSDIICTLVKQSSLNFTRNIIKTPKNTEEILMPIPGIYNLYNSLAAISALSELKISLNKIKKTFKQFQSPFGRVEKIKLPQNKTLQIFLVKNPAGFNEVLRTLAKNRKNLNLLIAINDLIADGQDVSWLWDVDFEKIVSKTKKVIFSGIRAEEIALRWKYAQKDLEKGSLIEKNFKKAISKGSELIKKGETLYILPTYTAMLGIRRTLHKMGLVHETWKD